MLAVKRYMSFGTGGKVHLQTYRRNTTKPVTVEYDVDKLASMTRDELREMDKGGARGSTELIAYKLNPSCERYRIVLGYKQNLLDFQGIEDMVIIRVDNRELYKRGLIHIYDYVSGKEIDLWDRITV